MTTTAAAYYPIDDEGWTSRPLKFGLIRCPDGDHETYRRLLAELLNELGIDADRHELAEPTWAWWRINPDWSGEYPWLLGHATGPGRGNFRGVLVREADPAPVLAAGGGA